MTSKRLVSLWRRWSAWLCLSLMLWMVAAESAHHHPSHTEANSCSICIVAHTANPAPSSSNTAPSFAAVGVPQEEKDIAKAEFDLSDAVIRGPPVL
jgi:hypothetical protein